MRIFFTQSSIDKRDFLLAAGVALFALIVFLRVLAPDVLYGDSGEFQTLAYTWGMTHTTGYPVYLILARIVGLLPMGTMAWRINLFSALCAACTSGGVYLITRHLTGRGGALLASLVLLVSYTFWSQSIIAEVYTPATALIVTIFLILLAWHRQPQQRRWLLVLVGFLLALGLGVHMFLMLMTPAVFLFVGLGVLFGAPAERGHWAHLLRLIAGTLLGFALFFLLFVFIDTRPTETNVFATSIYPARSAWNLSEADFTSEPERFILSVTGRQWQGAMLPSNIDYPQVIESFFNDDLAREFSPSTLALALIGVFATLLLHRRLLALIGAALLVAFAAGLVYFPGDKYIFYLPAYVMLAIFAGAGAGAEIMLLRYFTPKAIPRALPALILTLALIAVCVAPFITTRWKSVQRGLSGFITEDYVFSALRPNEPRRAAECALSKIPEDRAFVLAGWQALYSIYYVALVEQGRNGIVLREAMPYPVKEVAPGLLDQVAEQMQNGVAVYADDHYPHLDQMYNFTAVAGCSAYPLFRLTPRS